MLMVLYVHEMGIRALALPPVAKSAVSSQVRGERRGGGERGRKEGRRDARIERVVADHGEGGGGEGALLLGDGVHVLVVAPGEEDVVEAAAGRVDAVRRRIHGVACVRVGRECVRVDVLVGEGGADDVPLAGGAEGVVHQPDELHPLRWGKRG
jgi:hypothetical protein